MAPWLWQRWRTERQRSKDLLARAQWLQAELENVRKQHERERSQAGERAVEQAFVRLFPTLDACDAASGQPGVGLLAAELGKALAAEGLGRIAPAEGASFDPRLHEAVQREARPAATGERHGLVVARCLRAGYTHRGRVLRPAMVHVLELTEATQ
ncbi:MAG: nucleotide exchange factor GrpE [Halobacteriales archaeon]|nr:nucleotide exchange factor GrpE [Halobacteriales archaeon]